MEADPKLQFTGHATPEERRKAKLFVVNQAAQNNWSPEVVHQIADLIFRTPPGPTLETFKPYLSTKVSFRGGRPTKFSLLHAVQEGEVFWDEADSRWKTPDCDTVHEALANLIVVGQLRVSDDDATLLELTWSGTRYHDLRLMDRTKWAMYRKTTTRTKTKEPS
jgi:hypothetical protein